MKRKRQRVGATTPRQLLFLFSRGILERKKRDENGKFLALFGRQKAGKKNVLKIYFPENYIRLH